MNKVTQEAAILSYLRNGKSLTPLQALRWFNCLRLSGRIYDLRAQGHPIHAVMVERSGKRVASYSLGVK